MFASISVLHLDRAAREASGPDRCLAELFHWTSPKHLIDRSNLDLFNCAAAYYVRGSALLQIRRVRVRPSIRFLYPSQPPTASELSQLPVPFILKTREGRTHPRVSNQWCSRLLCGRLLPTGRLKNWSPTLDCSSQRSRLGQASQTSICRKRLVVSILP